MYTCELLNFPATKNLCDFITVPLLVIFTTNLHVIIFWYLNVSKIDMSITYFHAFFFFLMAIPGFFLVAFLYSWQYHL